MHRVCVIIYIIIAKNIRHLLKPRCLGVVSLAFRKLSKIISRKSTMLEITFRVRISSRNFVCVPKAWLWPHIQSFSLKLSLEVRFLRYTSFERIFWRAREMLMKQPPGAHLTIPTNSCLPNISGPVHSVHRSFMSFMCLKWHKSTLYPVTAPGDFKMLTYCDIINTWACRWQLWRHNDWLFLRGFYGFWASDLRNLQNACLLSFIRQRICGSVNCLAS